MTFSLAGAGIVRVSGVHPSEEETEGSVKISTTGWSSLERFSVEVCRDTKMDQRRRVPAPTFSLPTVITYYSLPRVPKSQAVGDGTR